MNRDIKKYIAACALILVVFLSGCASVTSDTEAYENTDRLVAAQDFPAAADHLAGVRGESYVEKDRVLYFLDAGMLYHYAGAYDISNEFLSDSDYAIEDLYTKSISRAIASGVLNDNALAYSGEDYEDIYLNIFKSLNYMNAGKLDDAHVELRRVNEKLVYLEDKYKKEAERFNSSGENGQVKAADNPFHNNALARWLSCLMYRREGSFDDARIDSELMAEAYLSQSSLYPFSSPPSPVLERPGKGMTRLSLLSFSDPAPYKRAETLFIDARNDYLILTHSEGDGNFSTDSLGTDRIFMPGLDPGFHMKIQFPKLVRRPFKTDRVTVLVDGEEMMTLPLIEDMGLIAEETYKNKQAVIFTKTIIRAVAKTVAKEIGKQQLNESEFGEANPLLGLLIGVAADIAVDVTENADLRMSRYFPARAWGAELELPRGEYDITFQYYLNGSVVYEDRKIQVDLSSSWNLLESFYL